MDKIPTVAIHTLGCKLNQAESELLSRRLSTAGFNLAQGRRADVFIVNTCTVTHVADSKSRHLVRMLRRQNPGALIVAVGCSARLAARELKECGADVTLANPDKSSAVDLLCQKYDTIRAASSQSGDRVRSFIKIQDGCANFCSYCIVPYVRSQVNSVPAEQVLDEIQLRVLEGYKEVVLTGTEIGSYNSNGVSLEGLIRRILRETAIPRLHLSSLQPQWMSRDLLGMWDDRRLCRHFHLALQSGSDSVLKRMKRCYTVADYQKALAGIRDIMPDASITTDIIVGFPGESEEDFRQSLALCEQMRLAAIHVFAYSARPGTEAAAMPDRVGDKVQKERSAAMLDLAELSSRRFARSLAGTTRPVLWENRIRQGEGIYSGLTDNYMRVYTQSSTDITNSITPVRLLQPVEEMKERRLQRTRRDNRAELWCEVIQ